MRNWAVLAALIVVWGAGGEVRAAPGPESDVTGATASTGIAASDLRHGALGSVTLDANVCRKIRSVAARFGESWAGYRVQQMLSNRACGGAFEENAEHFWSWPWRPGTSAIDVPPRLMGSIGDWELRCGYAGPRMRCALLHQASIPESADRIVTHFVISSVAGRETVLWRISAPRPVADVGREIGVRAGDHAAATRFDICFVQSCVSEGAGQDAAAVLDALWTGQAISFDLGARGEVAVPASGFREAFRELIRLRHEERRFTIKR